MRNNRTVLCATLIRTDTPNNNSISSRTPTTVHSAGQDRKLEEGSRAGKRKAFVVVVLMWIAVPTNCLARRVVWECSCGRIVDILLAVGGSWDLFRKIKRSRVGRTCRRSRSYLVRLRSIVLPWKPRRGVLLMRTSYWRYFLDLGVMPGVNWQRGWAREAVPSRTFLGVFIRLGRELHYRSAECK